MEMTMTNGRQVMRWIIILTSLLVQGCTCRIDSEGDVLVPKLKADPTRFFPGQGPVLKKSLVEQACLSSPCQRDAKCLETRHGYTCDCADAQFGFNCEKDPLESENVEIEYLPETDHLTLIINDERYLVCQDEWSTAAADVSCRLLGFNRSVPSPGTMFSLSAEIAGSNVGGYILGVRCSGGERDLKECTFLPPIRGCPSDRIVTLKCSTGAVDETPIVYPSGVRLSAGSAPHEGRVELAFSDRWYPLCSKYWDEYQADVTCRTLGYKSALRLSRRWPDPTSTIAVSDGKDSSAGNDDVDGQSSLTPITKLMCEGDEQIVGECALGLEDAFDCDLHRLAGVVCDKNECASDPCQNNGSCLAKNASGFFCACSGHFAGDYCDIDNTLRVRLAHLRFYTVPDDPTLHPRGFPEVNRNGTWYRLIVPKNGVDFLTVQRIATPICEMLGYKFSRMWTHTFNIAGPQVTIKCDGTETDIDQCDIKVVEAIDDADYFMLQIQCKANM